MTERDTPDSWTPGRKREPKQKNILSRHQQFRDIPASGISATGATSSSRKQRKANPAQELSGLSLDNTDTIAQPGGIISKLPRWMKSSALWLILLTLVPGAVGFLAISILLKLPSAPNCPAIFWPLASASVRLHCAQLAASKQTVDDLLQAIALVKELPENHPLRKEIDRFIEVWSKDILHLADQSFQSGNLEEAMKIARQIPSDLQAYELVDEQITKWEIIWSKAETIYQTAEKELSERHWQSAFMLASKLLRIDNKYWSTTKYDQLNTIIASAREDGDKLEKAEHLASSRVVEKILEAIKIAESIKQESYLYGKAQDLIPALGRKMLELAQAKMDRKDADAALEIVRQIPESTNLQTEIDDFIALGEAQRSAWLGTVYSLEEAISQAQRISSSRAVYTKAQNLISRWQLEIEDVTRLEKARNLASLGTISDLTAAIREAQQIPGGNPRFTEAKQETNRWRTQVETIEDQPTLDRAQQIALLEDTNSLQAAIAEANQIRSGRALYPEARKKIRTWTAKIQKIQDQPYLDQARSLADNGDLPGAIKAAQPIASSGRALAGEAQQSIDDWRGQIVAKENWQKAREIALAGTPEALAEAIRLANQIPKRSTVRIDATTAIDQWSQQLLEIARSQSQSDLNRAISIAKLVPRSSLAYTDAQEQIRTWRQILSPPPPQVSPQPQLSPSPTLE